VEGRGSNGGLVEGGDGLVEGDCGSSAVVVWWRPAEGIDAVVEG
jgi:hypothetical protein